MGFQYRDIQSQARVDCPALKTKTSKVLPGAIIGDGDRKS